MGCCEGKNIYEGTENEVENSIRNAMTNLEINTLPINDFLKRFEAIVKYPIHEIEDSKIYSLPIYSELISSLIVNSRVENLLIRQQNTFILSPDAETSKNFHMYFFLQIFALLRGSNEEKINLLEKFQKVHFMPLTVKKMLILINEYLDTNLILATVNYLEKNNLKSSPEGQKLESKIFEQHRVNSFSKMFFRNLKDIVCKNKPQLRESKEAYENTILKGEFREFFYENKILLDGLELRKFYYSEYLNSVNGLNYSSTGGSVILNKTSTNEGIISASQL